MARKRPAPYVPLSVYYADDEAIMEAGEDAELMYVRMLAYAGRTPTTEGYVPKRVCLTRLGIAVRPELGPETSPESRLERLTDTGLVAVEGDGYRLVSWLKWNRSVEEMNREQAQDRARKTPLTRRAPEQDPEDVPETGPEKTPESISVPSGSTEAEEKREKTCASADADALFAEFWDAFNHKFGKQRARTNWEKAVKKTDPQIVIAGARRYAKWVSGEIARDPRFKPKWAEGWLTERRWEDELDAAAQAPEQRGSFTAPPLPEGAPRALYVPWNRAHRDAWLAGKTGPTDWHALQVAS